MYSNIRLLCICFLFSHISYINAAETKQNSKHELQILIDVSGSMKLTDPKNLRIPAVKLLINLIPEGTKAGLWLFAQKTTVLVKTGVVNAKWKNKALSKLKKIHSSGLFTNIEDAIQVSAKEWFSTSSKVKRNLILLTDGMVDVSKDIMQSAESRDRIMAELVPLLQQAGAKVHTIALSENADSELLDKLALDTNGWSEIAQSASELQKVFFRIYKKAVPQDTLPLKGNVFKVDASIKEFSVLIFKKADAADSQLYTPDKLKISNTDKIDNVTWLNEKNYDLVTVKNPKSGEWKIVAEMDPDNQVMIVTDLKFNVDEIPNHISENELFKLTAFFTEQQQLISREDFLSLIEISIEQKDEQGGSNKWIMQPVSGKKGLFSHSLETALGKGKHTIKLVADGKTFKRESVHTIEVKKSLVTIEINVNKDNKSVTLKLSPDLAILHPDMTIKAFITQASMDSEAYMIKKTHGNWEIDIEAPAEGKSKIINFSIMAKTLQGSLVSPDVKPVIFNDKLFSKLISSPESTEPVKLKKEQSKEDEEKVKDEKDKDNTNEKPVEEKNTVNWVKTSSIVIGINIILIVAGFFVFKWAKKNAGQKQAQILDRLA